MQRSASLFVIFLAAILAVAPAYAQQAQTFSTFRRGGAQEFTYIYPTATKQPQTLNVRLNLSDIERGSAEFQPWNEPEARTIASAAAQTAAQALSTPNLTVTVAPTPRGIEIAAAGTDPRLTNPAFFKQLEAQILPAYQDAQVAYARPRYYRVTPKGDTVSVIMPDHAAIATRYTAPMRPVAKAIIEQVPGAGQGPRPFITAALNWLQTIPYDTLENRTTSNGAGFQTPYGLMLGNRGDCDTKATALAALIRAAYPQIPLAIIYVPDHAFLAIGLPQQGQDYALKTQYGTYILADATGPGLTPLGYIDEPTRAKIRTSETDVLPIQ